MSCARLAKDNPFRVDRVLRLRYRQSSRAWHELLTALEQTRVGAVVGLHGSGKTTLLEDLSDYYRSQQEPVLWLAFSTEKRQLSPSERAALQALTPKTRVFVDGVEQLNLAQQLQLRWRTRVCRSVVVSAHRAGVWPVLLSLQATPSVFAALAGALYPGLDRLDHELINSIFYNNNGNLREGFRECYDRWAEGEL
jgi:energy-coupling factor transporter ATP-binding protein EcfA2